ncbi:MAG: hypothetical protein ACHQ49_13220 [Elusimicrobiota bacterium]
MDDRESPYLYGALSLLDDSRRTVEALFCRFEQAQDARTKREIAESALHELKVYSTIEELFLPLEPESIEPEAKRRGVRSLIAEFESMRLGHLRHDDRFAALSRNVRGRIGREAGARPEAV